MYSPESLAHSVGFIAAVCTTFSFVPQLLKIKRQGGEDLSYVMLSVYLIGILLWLFYGLLLRAPAIIFANIATALLVALAIVFKATWKPARTFQGQADLGD